MIGERLSQVFNEAGAFAADLFGVNAALCLAEGHDAYFHGRDGEFGALGAGRVLRQFGAQVRIDIVISRFRVAASPVIIASPG